MYNLELNFGTHPFAQLAGLLVPNRWEMGYFRPNAVPVHDDNHLKENKVKWVI